MRTALLVLLVACGSKSKPAEPASNTTATPSPSTASVPPATCPTKPLTVAVFELQALDPMSAPHTEVFSDNLRAAAESDPCMKVVVPAMSIAEAKEKVKCASEMPLCMAAIGMEEGADVMIYGRVEQAGQKLVFSVRRLDVAKRRTEAMWMDRFDPESDFAAIGREAFFKLSDK